VIHIRCDHVLQRDAPGFWSWYFDRDAISDFFVRGLQFKRYEIVSQIEDEASIHRTIECHPHVALPRPVRALFRGGFRYVETGVFDKQSGTWRFSWTPSAFRERLKIDGWMRVEALDGVSCRRLAETTVDARFPGLRGLIESTGEQIIGRIWDRSAAVMNEWFLRDVPSRSDQFTNPT
jgi:hypothetical protein